jgi:hypothetical protein
MSPLSRRSAWETSGASTAKMGYELSRYSVMSISSAVKNVVRNPYIAADQAGERLRERL